MDPVANPPSGGNELVRKEQTREQLDITVKEARVRASPLIVALVLLTALVGWASWHWFG
jgi:hypothetical protein